MSSERDAGLGREWMGSCLILVGMLIPSIRLNDDLNVKSLQIPIALTLLLETFLQSYMFVRCNRV
jgi:hypothetical protein